MAHSLFTSESVSVGHPDKVADQISDAILDAILKEDPEGRVACETLVSSGLVVLAGEITSLAHIDYQAIVRKTIERIGYTDPDMGFDYRSCGIIVSINKQSRDIAQGVREGEEQGAGDQGMMFGYACDETDVLMPLPIMLARRIVDELYLLRKSGALSYLRPDGKSQVTVEYDDLGIPRRIHTIVISAQHSPEVSHAQIVVDMEKMCRRLFPPTLLDGETRFFINPTGRFVIGGPLGDCGLTGRKIIVDTYGVWADTVVEPSQERILQRWIAQELMRRAMLRRQLWVQVLQDDARCSWPTQLGCPTLSLLRSMPRDRTSSLKSR